MKILAVILSIYVMLLTSIACTDNFESFADNETISATIDNDIESDYYTDSCSPFCSCVCCVGFTQPTVLETSIKMFDAIKTSTAYQQSEYFSGKYSLFQPPKA